MAAVLLTATSLTPLLAGLALADGGHGGQNGGAGGSGFTGNRGSDGGQLGGGGGGGGGGAGGGAGGTGVGLGTGAGGAGGTSGSPNGAAGGTGSESSGFLGTGGGGGGGGWNGNGAGAAAISNGSPLAGGMGGAGGSGAGYPGGGGGGGAGGYGAVVTGSGPSSNTSTITGGAGGNGARGGDVQGGPRYGPGGGGDGGVGILFSASGASFTNSGSITGGAGGAGFSGELSPGSGGAGIVGSGLAITNSGTIAGGFAGHDGESGGAQANAITFTGGANSLTLLAGSNISGNIDVTGSLALSVSTSVSVASTITGTGSVTKTGAGTLVLAGNTTYSGGTTVTAGILQLDPGTTLAAGAALAVNGGTVNLNGNNQTVGALSGTGGAIALGGGVLTAGNSSNTALAAAISGTGALVKQGSGTLALSGASSYSGGTTISGGLINFAAASNLGTGLITLNGGGLQWATGSSTDISSRLAALGSSGGVFDTNGNNVTFATALTGPGGLTKQGTGTLTLSSASNSYGGGATVTGGTLQLGVSNALPVGSALILNGGTFDLNNHNQTVGALSGTGGTIALGNGTLTAGSSSSTSLAVGFTSSSSGTLVKQGSGTLTYTPNGQSNAIAFVSVDAGTLLLMAGSTLVSKVTVNSGGTLGGTGSILGDISNFGTIAPGASANTIGTLSMVAYGSHSGSTYQVDVNANKQSDLVQARDGRIDGGVVQVNAQGSGYNPSGTTYTIINTSPGTLEVTSPFSSVSLTASSPLLSASLSYDQDNVYLTLMVQQGAFSAAGVSGNQKAVGGAFDRAFAGSSGDFATVVGGLTELTAAQLPAAYDALSGQPIANFGTVNVQSAALFMSALGQQMALARGGTAGSGARQALAQACEIATCDAAPSPFSVWGSLLGGLGRVQGDGNAGTLTYNFGGAAAGIDYRIDPRFVVGIGAGYTHGTQWVNNFLGQGWSDSVSIAAYGSFTQAGFYADLLAGYAYYGNQIQRQIVIPGLQARTATGSTGANQFLGQVETGYRIGIYAPAAASLTPFVRLQGSTATQNGFSESGAQSLSLTVAQQTTSSLRTLLGADLAGVIPLGSQRQLDLALRLGWQHEYADTPRPMTATFSGAPFAPFTAYGATPQRDAAVIGFSAATRIADAAQLYLRYDGELSSGSDYHALNVGVRFTW